MQNTKTNEVQATIEAQQQLQQLCNFATNELHETFSYKEVKTSLQNALLGWVTHDQIENTPQLERFEILDFFQSLSNHLEFVESKILKTPEVEIQIENYSIFLQSSSKKINAYFQEVMYSFLMSEVADDRDIRSDVVYQIGEIQKYVNKIFKLQRNSNPKKVLQLS
jgi:L-rhamnose mutarotase